MAVYTALSTSDAERLNKAYGLGSLLRVEPIVAGSVNSNYYLHTAKGSFFARLYEEQEVEGVDYEWALLRHLGANDVPVPIPLVGPRPGECRVLGKCTAIFPLIEGEELCQRKVDEVKAHKIGEALAHAHLAGATFERRREGRFDHRSVVERLDQIRILGRPELSSCLGMLEDTLVSLGPSPLEGLPTGPIHGDLFRDNVRWREGRVAGLLDWESASDGVYLYDLAVTLLAWCCGDTLEWPLMAALVAGYRSRRELGQEERARLREALLVAALRFTVTRITDFHLRADDGGQQMKKDYRRFEMRLRIVAAERPDALGARLGF